MPRKTLTAVAAGLIALGGLAVGADPASATASCPSGQAWNAMGVGSGFCAPVFSGGGTGGNTGSSLGGKTPPAPKAPVFTRPKAPTKSTTTIVTGPRVYVPIPVSATAKVGSVLKAGKQSWPKGMKVSYRWLRNGSPISGATSSSYKVKRADKGMRVNVRVTGTRPGYTGWLFGDDHVLDFQVL
ncbi:hypothetical protein [Arthrobacter sp. ok362]|uniref:hypothetical protein n=1 Tax=Arthrobacter sp. ok362 TaxID=1761745 RepID=UPI0008924C48|nr:hypothetical protein [Arthrobacter sp. ok362]SDL53252.1 hypothetical protein SAMN04487913_110163 [Arthrobacter sp. ok362]